MRAGEDIFCAETLQVAGTDNLSSHVCYRLVGLQSRLDAAASSWSTPRPAMLLNSFVVNASSPNVVAFPMLALFAAGESGSLRHRGRPRRPCPRNSCDLLWLRLDGLYCATQLAP